jgi:hypothetical protein
MQKVEGSSPFVRFAGAPQDGELTPAERPSPISDPLQLRRLSRVPIAARPPNDRLLRASRNVH